MPFHLNDTVVCVTPHKGWLEVDALYRVIDIKRECHIDLIQLEEFPDVWWNEKRFKPWWRDNSDPQWCNYCQRWWVYHGHSKNCPKVANTIGVWG